jgi:hypothetical protein
VIIYQPIEMKPADRMPTIAEMEAFCSALRKEGLPENTQIFHDIFRGTFRVFATKEPDKEAIIPLEKAKKS